MQSTSKKRNSFIRFRGLLIPVGFALLIAGYVLLIADAHLKRAVEHYASLVNGAQVNIQSLHTHLLRGQVDLVRIQIAHHTHPSRNLFEIGKLSVKFLWLPLLAGKFVSPEIQIEGVKLFTNRDNFGALNIPSDSPSLPPGLLDRVATGMSEKLRKELGDTPLRKLGLLSAGLGTQTRVDQLRTQLSSMKKMAELEKEIEFQTSTWERAASVFHPAPWVETARNALHELKAKTARRLASDKQTVESIRKQIRADKQKASETYQGILNQNAILKKALYSLDDTLNEDATKIRDSFGLPRLDGNDFTHSLMGPKLLNFLDRASYWVDVSRRRMPNSGHDYDGIIVMERPVEYGTEVQFGKKSTYPNMLLMKVTITSSASDDKNQGVVTGELRNFTTNPPIWRQPTEMKVRADFPGIGVRNLKITALIDHTQSVPLEEFRMSLDSFPLTDWMLENTSDLKLRVKHADAKISFDGSFRGDEVLTQWSVLASQVEYDVETRFRLMQETLRDAFIPYSTLYASGSVKGPTKNLKLELASNVGKRLGPVLRDKFKHSLEAVDDIVRQSILDQIEIPRRRLRDKLAEVIGRVSNQYEAHVKTLKELENGVLAVEGRTRPRFSHNGSEAS